MAAKSASVMNDASMGEHFYAATIGVVAKELLLEMKGWLTGVAESVELSPGQTLTICDYGSADGSTSLDTVQSILDISRRRFGSEQQVMVIYEDQPENNYRLIFLKERGMLTGRKVGSCLTADPNVFVTACGTGFHSRCLPDNTVNIGIACSSFYFLSKIPCKLKTAVDYTHGASKKELSIWQDVARADWERLLLHRAKEMVPGGYLALCMFTTLPSGGRMYTPCPSTDPDRGQRFSFLMQKIVEDMLRDQRITQAEAHDINLPVYYRTEEEVRAPFLSSNSPVRRAGLQLVKIKTKSFDCTVRNFHMRDTFDEKRFAKIATNLSRALANSAVVGAFTKQRSTEEGLALADEYFQRLQDALTADPDNYGRGSTVLYALLHRE